MDRNREGRRGSLAAANGLSRRRHRSGSLRDSPEEDGPVELQETARLRDRGNKKDRDRDRSGRDKRRRGDRLMHGSNREEAGDDSTEESIDEEEEDEDEDSGPLRMLPPNPTSSSSLLYHHHQRKSFPPAKIVRAAPTWKVADEMIGVSVPRKARSASGKRSHECWMSSSVTGGGGAEQIHRQASTSPARPNVTAPSIAPISPSSFNVSLRKKMKPIGPKHRPPKMSKSSSSSMQEDIEIEVAEVLYGLMKQSQCPPKQEVLANASQKLDCKDTNGSSNEVRSRVSSPISISPPAAGHQPSMLPQNSSASTTSLPVLAPKRKKPRPVKLEEESPAIVAGRNGSISSDAAKVENEQPAKLEISSPKSEKNSGSASQNAGASVDLGSSLASAAVFSLETSQSEPVKAESNTVSDLKPLTEESKTRDGVQIREEVPSPKKESTPCTKLDIDLADATATKKVSTAAEVECKREEKFKIDLMAPPPPLKSSPERDGDMEYVSDCKSIAIDVEMVPKAEAPVMEKEKMEKIPTQDAGEIGLAEKKRVQLVEESESQKPLADEERIFNLQLDLEKPHKDSGAGSVSGSKQQQPQLSQVQKQQQQQQQPKTTSRNDPKTEKIAQPTSLPLPMNRAGWPGGLPSVGYMPPLQAVLSMDGSTGSSTAVQPPHLPLSQPRPKKCATHYHIARNIYYHQQFTRMNPFWPAATGSASMYGPKPYNLNVVPATESTILGHPLQGNFAGRSLNSVQDKVLASSTISGQNAKDKSSAPAAANFMDATHRKQLVLQQATQPAGAGNLLHGPAFIFPMSQQQAAAAAASRSTAVKSFVATGNVAVPSTANSGPVAPVTSSSPAAGTATTVSFNYPNLPANEAQYLAILQNNGYPFSIPAHVGSSPPYRGGNPAQAMPFFNGSFYSSQMIHTAQLQQQAQAPPHSQPQAGQQGHQNTSTSSGSSSSQKHQQAQQQQLQGVGKNGGGGGSSNNFPATKNRLPMQQQQQQQNHPIAGPNQSRRHEGDAGGEDSPSTADSRVSHAQKSIYGQNFAVPIHPHNFALMAPAALGGGGNGSHGEQQQQQQQSLKSQAFAMSFASFNGAATQGLDFSSMAQNHAICLPDAARHGYHIAAAAAATQAAQQKNHQISEERKTGGDSINSEVERKGTTGKATAGVGQSLAFSRPDSTDPNVCTVLGNSVIDSCGRTLNLISAPINANRAARPTTSTSTATTAAPISSSSTQHQQQQQQQQLIQLQQQRQMPQQLAAAVSARSKTPTSSNASVYSDCLPSSSSMAARYPNAPSVFPQALMQSSSPAQSPQWKNSARTTGAAVPSPTSTSSQKNLPQQQSRIHHGHTHISFGVNTKPATASQGQQLPMNNQSQSPPTVGSPPTSSISKGAGGSPKTGSSGGKSGSSPAPSSQQPKSSQSGQSRKSSPVGGRNVPSILGNSNMSTAPSSCGKSQSQVQQQQLQKQTLQQPQLYFTNAYMQQAPSPQSSTATTTATTTCMTGYYHQRRQNDQQQHGASAVPSSGMLSLCSPSLTLAGVGTSDPARAVAAAAAAANSMKGGMPPSGLLHAAQYATQTAGHSRQLMSAAFPYIHPVPTVSVKPAEQKQPAGSDNLHNPAGSLRRDEGKSKTNPK